MAQKANPFVFVINVTIPKTAQECAILCLYDLLCRVVESDRAALSCGCISPAKPSISSFLTHGERADVKVHLQLLIYVFKYI